MNLRVFSTIKIGGEAEKIIQLKDLATLKETLPQPIRILGNGSNVLIDDRGLKGTIIVIRDFPPLEPEIIFEDSDSVHVKVSAGLFLPTLARFTARRGLTGCEYMVGVPGTVGGALIQNAGANDQEFKDVFLKATLFNFQTQEQYELTKEECELSYRWSALKTMPQKLVLSVVLNLKKGEIPLIEKQVQKNLDYRKQKTPYSKPSLGSIYTRLKNKNEWIYPGKLIEEAGLKRTRIGDALVSPMHANYIVNEGRATFENVLKLMEMIEQKVLEHSGYKLHREILVWTDEELSS